MIASLILLLYFSGILILENAVMALYVTAALLIVAEALAVSFGLLTLNALLAGYAGYSLQQGVDPIFNIAPNWQMMFGIAFVEVIVIICVVFIYKWVQGQKVTTGNEAMIGQKVTALKWEGKKGQVRYEGEIWQAYSDQPITMPEDSQLRILAVEKMKIRVCL